MQQYINTQALKREWNIFGAHCRSLVVHSKIALQVPPLKE